MDEADDRDAGDHPAARDDVPGPVELREEGTCDVVRQEERGQGDDDQVVEEQNPARDEAPEVVERDADERRGAARLADRGRSLSVRERDDEEEEAGREQHRRREPERAQGDDSEREVDRGGDLPVGDREQCGSVENPLQPRELPCH